MKWLVRDSLRMCPSWGAEEFAVPSRGSEESGLEELVGVLKWLSSSPMASHTGHVA